MKLLILVLALLGSTLAICPDAPGNVKSQQEQLQKIVDGVNRYQPGGQSGPANIDLQKYYALGHLDQDDIFSLFDERNAEEVRQSIQYLIDPSSFDGFIQAATQLSHIVNDELFLYALSVAVLRRPDTAGVHVPRIHDVFPDKFIPRDILQNIRESAITKSEQAEYYYNPVTRNYLNVEDRLNYFTDDLGLNSHHHHYHVLHPPTGFPGQSHSDSDRHGEFFYWMHHQFVARYEAERLSNGLPLTEPFENWDEEIHTGYAPHLTVFKKGYNYNFRPEGLVLSDLPELTKNKMRLWKSSLLYAIQVNQMIAANGSSVDIHNSHGIDVVTNAVVSTNHTINRPLYGNLHNYAHVIASRVSDHDGRYGVEGGAIEDVVTSARDPLFYQWHKFIDEILQEHKDSLHPYSQYQLTWSDIELKDTSVVPAARPDEPNVIHTYYSSSRYQIRQGFDFTRDRAATINVNHLNHEPFKYRLRIRNNAQEPRTAAVRIFLAPKYDEQGHRFEVNEQRKLMIELDKYVLTVQPGEQNYLRSSAVSSVTVPTSYIYDDVQKVPHTHRCACGWPEYLLLPRGSYEGMEFELFVAVTDWNEDQARGNVQPECQCSQAWSYCGSLQGTYPDSRPLGYPFDRHVEESSWEDYLPHNIQHRDVVIQFVGYQNPHQENNQ